MPRTQPQVASPMTDARFVSRKEAAKTSAALAVRAPVRSTTGRPKRSNESAVERSAVRV